MTKETVFIEPVLPDSYPVYMDYYYVVDGKVVDCQVFGTVAQLKKALKAKEIRQCDMVARGLRKVVR